jgi:hypothetical protein
VERSDYLFFPQMFWVSVPLSFWRWMIMLDKEFKKQRARIVLDLAEKANDPFIKGRLLDLALRYEDDGPKAPMLLTPIDLQFEWQGTGPER